jgi:hypothetical protein
MLVSLESLVLRFRDVEQVREIFSVQGFLQEFRFCAGLFWSGNETPEIQRDATKELSLPTWVQFLLLWNLSTTAASAGPEFLLFPR